MLLDLSVVCVPVCYLEFVLLAVDDDSSDLLVHEDEDGAEKGRNYGHQNHPPGVRTKRRDQPATVL